MKNLIIITNTYGFLGNRNCVAYFNTLVAQSNGSLVYLDESFGLKNVKRIQTSLSRELHAEIFLSGKYFFDRFQVISADEKLSFYSEGLFSPFQMYAYHKLNRQISKYTCFSSVMPYGFQKIHE
jgi:hypothetical protein